MIIRINGEIISSSPTSVHKVIEDTKKVIDGCNRQTRRHKYIRRAVATFTFLSTLGIAFVTKAQELGQDEEKPTSLMFIKQVIEQISSGIAPIGGVQREDTLVWKLNQYMTNTILTTHDFFHNPEIIKVFGVIWSITMSCTTLLIAKKGFDMVKARVVGANTIGATELFIRLIASVVMTFLSLDVIQLGIEASNLITKTLLQRIGETIVPYHVLENLPMIGLIFWFIAYMIMFVILAIQYWVRQITVVFLGLLTPVANMSWVVDGGAMLKSLIKELATLLTTPIAHGLIMTVGTVIMLETAEVSAASFTNSLNALMISLSTIFLMIITPSFLRRFISGSANPAKWAFDTAVTLKTFPAKAKKILKIK